MVTSTRAVPKNLTEYEIHWNAGTKPPTPIAGLQGRFCRMKPGEPTALSDDADRRIVFLVDHETCHSSLGVPGYSVCIGIGWDAEYTAGKVNAGYRFAWVVFPEGDCPLGDWSHMIDLAEDMYPECADKIRRHRAALSNWTPASLRDMESRLGYRLLDIDNGKYVRAATPKADPKSDPRYMTVARYAAIRLGSPEDTVEACRAFFYFAIHCKELFFGDGWTRNNLGQKGCKEYVMPSKPLAALGSHREFAITVRLPKVGGVARPPRGAELPPPPFFDPDNAAEWGYQPVLEGYLPGMRGLTQEAAEWVERYHVTPAGTDTFKIAMLGIDLQGDFCNPKGTLFVGGRSGVGAIEDCANIARFIYANMRRLTSIHLTLDSHWQHQIFFSSFWRASLPNGKTGPIAPHRVITTKQIRAGDVVPNAGMAKWLCNGNYPWLLEQVLDYCDRLEKAGKYSLYIWPPHCIMGSHGHALNGVVLEAASFHGYCRSTNVNYEIKGGNPLTENYSVMQPEVMVRHDGRSLGGRNTTFLKTLLNNDVVVIVGEASSHCVKASIDDILSEIQATDPALASRVYVVQNCMSPVVVPGGTDFTAEADAALARFAAAGMHVVSSETPMEEWPGLAGRLTR